MRSWTFDVPAPYRAYGRWWFAVEGIDRRCHGPFPTEPLALAARESLFVRWVRRAASLGGHALRLADARWVVTLPDHAACAGRPFVGEAIARAAPEPAGPGGPPARATITAPTSSPPLALTAAPDPALTAALTAAPIVPTGEFRPASRNDPA
jgi:hypothetical protein